MPMTEAALLLLSVVRRFWVRINVQRIKNKYDFELIIGYKVRTVSSGTFVFCKSEQTQDGEAPVSYIDVLSSVTMS